MTNENPLKQVGRFGQSIWCDNVERRMITSGAFQKMINEDGLKGVTSNPTIFEKAVTGSQDYDKELHTLGDKGLSTEQIYWDLMIRDIRDVADIFLPVFEQTKGIDGYVSIEVSPVLANDTAGTIRQAEELWNKVGKKNVMIKIPATPQGLPAIEETISKGINVNVTLIFSIERYQKVMEAFIKGLERRAQAGKPVSGIASVASFFVSRVDSEVDKLIDEKIAAAKDEGQKKALNDLKGQAAIANSKIAYEEFEKVFSTPRFRALKEKGAQLQRPLWASTSTKNPAYRDVIYVETLIGPNTVNTVPPATIDAFRDHGKPADRIREGLREAHQSLQRLETLGISLESVTHQLEIAGVKSFSDSFHKLIERIKQKEVQIGVKTK